ncbi:MAG: beta-propeller fold lactonase family protein [Bacteroidales bacterium]|nr:beta-propeller fold lactonase family protein [Bacteroidales bacterium]
MELIVGTYGQRLRLLELGIATFEVLNSSVFEAENTSCLALSPDRRFLFAVSESGDNSGVYSFEIHPYDRLKPLPFGRIVKRSEIRGTSPDPCYLLYLSGYYNQCGDPDNGALLTADYSGGSISVFPVQDGRILPPAQVVRFDGHGPDPERQLSAHIHHLVRYGSILLAVDLGSDCIHVLRMFDSTVRPLCDNRLNRELRLEPLFDVPVPSGSGPRHLVIDRSGSHFYVLTELSNELLVYSMPDFTAMHDRPTLLQRLPVGDPACPEQAGGDLQLSPDGQHLYASLRNGDDGLVIARVRPDGLLERIGYQRTGAHVRDFFFLPEGLPTGEYMVVFCKNENAVQFYRRKASDGSLILFKEIAFNAFYGEPVHGVVLSEGRLS